VLLFLFRLFFSLSGGACDLSLVAPRPIYPFFVFPSSASCFSKSTQTPSFSCCFSAFAFFLLCSSSKFRLLVYFSSSLGVLSSSLARYARSLASSAWWCEKTKKAIN
jgi:hypothetical protein